jgi:patatin-related protein
VCLVGADKPSISGGVKFDKESEAATWKSGSTLGWTTTGSALGKAKLEVTKMGTSDGKASVSDYFEAPVADASKTSDAKTCFFTMKIKKEGRPERRQVDFPSERNEQRWPADQGRYETIPSEIQPVALADVSFICPSRADLAHPQPATIASMLAEGSVETGKTSDSDGPQEASAQSINPIAEECGKSNDRAFPTDEYEQEIRFAVVMYGGVSLAIYIHGVAQELLRLVRATSGADLTDKHGNVDNVAEIYSELSQQVRSTDPDDKRKRCKTRFVIDILSGTSAGGINAIFLGKALAQRAQDLDQLRQTWLDTADMNKLLNTGGLLEPKRSLLKSEWMYEQLYKAFRDMEDEKKDPEGCYTPERLDLFVTVTDLNGVAVPIRLADKAVPEKIHKGCFNFRYDNVELKRSSGKDCAELDRELNQLARNDFQEPFDAMLAFAARCTSSFPVAFEPMKLSRIREVIGNDAYQKRREKYRRFFGWVPPEPLVHLTTSVDFDERELADGGYLDNKPFGHAIDAMTFRPTKLRHCRKLLYLDPFPELASGEGERTHFDFLENALAAASSLPRYQTIRQEIDRVGRSNSTQIRLHALQDLVRQNASAIAGFSVARYNQSVGGETGRSVRELTADFGLAYASYHKVRLMDSTDDLAHIVSGLHESTGSQDLFLAVRYLVQAWRNKHYSPDREHSTKFETDFFMEFDYSFRLRRAVHLLEWAQKQQDLPEVCESLIQQLTRLLRTRERLSLADAKNNPIWAKIRDLAKRLSWDDVISILEPSTDEDRENIAKDFYSKDPLIFDGVADAVRGQWERVFACNRRELEELRKKYPQLNDEYVNFDFTDLVSQTFLEGSDVSEHTEIEVYRISPADGIQRPLGEKLAGYALWDFGAFLRREWRENDMFWGRLDAAERIVSATLTHQDDKEMKDCYIQRLQRAIVEQEAARSRIDLSLAVAAANKRALPQYLKDQYQLPGWPDRDQSASQIAKASGILGRMFEEDRGGKNRATDFLRSAGALTTRIIGLLAPRSLWQAFLTYWFQLLLVMTLLFAALGELLINKPVRNFALTSFVVVLAAWLLAWVFSEWLGRTLPKYVVRLLQWVPALALILLIVVGVRHFPEDWQLLWRRISEIIGRC